MREGRKSRLEKRAISKTKKILELMQSIGSISMHKKYVYKEDDAKKIIEALEDELQELKRKLNYIES